jgi:hypothetical protein
MNRDGDPLPSLRGLDLVSIPPAMLVVLHVIVKNEEVGAADLVEIAPPRQIGRLQDYNFHSPVEVV